MRTASAAAAALAAALAIVSLAAPAARAGGSAEQCPLGRTIVLLRDGVDADAAARRLSARYEGVVCRVYRHSIRGVTLQCAGPNVVAALSHDPLVAAVEPDVKVTAWDGAATPPPQRTPTGIARMGLLRSPLVRFDGRDRRVDVGVAVIDTGIDETHPDLAVARSVSFVDGSRPEGDVAGHGTHCAGIIGARDNGFGVVGVAPGARLYSVKVLGDDGSGSLSDVIAGVDWVAQHAGEIAVANMSLGVNAKSESLHAAIRGAVRAGVVFVAAAGNEGADVFGPDGREDTGDDAIPASYPEVCAVSALADSDGLPGGKGPATRAGPDDSLATFSNFSAHPHARPLVRSPGGAIDLAAPGVQILSCWPGGGYRSLSGTSMASPHVAGLFALAIAVRGRDWNGDGKVDERDVYAMRQALIDAAEPQTAWRSDGATADPDGAHEGLASAALDLGAALTSAPAPGGAAAPAATGRPRPALAPPGVTIVGTVAPSHLRRGERSGIVVGVKNGGERAASFDVVVLDAVTGRGIGRRAVTGLAPGAVAAIVFPCDRRSFDPDHPVRAVPLANEATRAAAAACGCPGR
jgi:subtilisin family serine protease